MAETTSPVHVATNRRLEELRYEAEELRREAEKAKGRLEKTKKYIEEMESMKAELHTTLLGDGRLELEWAAAQRAVEAKEAELLDYEQRKQQQQQKQEEERLARYPAVLSAVELSTWIEAMGPITPTSSGKPGEADGGLSWHVGPTTPTSSDKPGEPDGGLSWHSGC
jgi:hypothetical protein